MTSNPFSRFAIARLIFFPETSLTIISALGSDAPMGRVPSVRCSGKKERRANAGRKRPIKNSFFMIRGFCAIKLLLFVGHHVHMMDGYVQFVADEQDQGVEIHQ